MNKLFLHFSKDVKLSDEVLLKELDLYPVELDLNLSSLVEKFDRKNGVNYQTYFRSYLFDDIDLTKSQIIQVINNSSIEEIDRLLTCIKINLEFWFKTREVSEIYVNDSDVAKLLSKFNLKYNFI